MSDVFIKIKTDYDNSGIVKADKALGGLLNSVLKGSVTIATAAAAGVGSAVASQASQASAQAIAEFTRMSQEGNTTVANKLDTLIRKTVTREDLKRAVKDAVAETL